MHRTVTKLNIICNISSICTTLYILDQRILELKDKMNTDTELLFVFFYIFVQKRKCFQLKKIHRQHSLTLEIKKMKECKCGVGSNVERKVT